MGGALATLATLAAGCYLSIAVLNWRGRFESVLVGLALALPLYLLMVTLGLQSGLDLPTAAYLGPLLWLGILPLGRFRADAPRLGPALGKAEKLALLSAVLGVWLYTNLMQVVTVDDDYWLHTPVQGRMLRGVIPPTNPYFPDLTLGGHFGRDLLVVSTSVLSGRDIFGAQVLLTSFCQSLGLAMLYLALRRRGTALSATAGSCMGWLGINVAHRVGLVDFFQNNGAPTYLILALMALLLCELWERPGRKLALVCGAVLGIYATVYETHFGLVVLSVLVMQLRCTGAARRATALALALAALLAVGGGSALARLTRPAQALDNAIANQSQTVRMSFPKRPFLALRIEVGELDPISVGYRVGLGKPLFRAFDHKPTRSDPRYVRLWSWNVIRMHWLGVWLCPLTLLLLLPRREDNAPLFFWLFGAWGYLIPGMIDFGPIHEFEWFRWEFAAGFGLAVAAGSALGSTVRGRRSGVLLGLALALMCQAGWQAVGANLRLLGNSHPAEIFGLRFDSRAWLLRHGDWLRLQEADLRTLDLIARHPERGPGTLFFSLGPVRPWDILFESTAMGLVDAQALGHAFPPPGEPVGVPPFRLTAPYQEFVANPSGEKARDLGIRWLYYRGDDLEVERRLASHLRPVYLDALAYDGRRRLLFVKGEALPPAGKGSPLSASPGVRVETLKFGAWPAGARYVEANYLNRDGTRLRSPAWIPPCETIQLAVPAQSTALQLYFMGEFGVVSSRKLELAAPSTDEEG